MWVVNLGFTKLGGNHLFAGQSHFQPGRRGLDSQRVGKQRLGLGVKNDRGIPLIGWRRQLEHIVGAMRCRRWRLVAALGAGKVGASAYLYGLCGGSQRNGNADSKP